MVWYLSVQNLMAMYIVRMGRRRGSPPEYVRHTNIQARTCALQNEISNSGPSNSLLRVTYKMCLFLHRRILRHLRHWKPYAERMVVKVEAIDAVSG